MNLAHRPGWKVPLLGLLLGLILGLAGGQPARAADNLRAELRVAAERIAALLKERNLSSIACGVCTGPATLPTSGGTLIRKTLTEELEKQGVKVAQRADVGVEGKYLPAADKQSGGLVAADIVFAITTSNGKELARFD